MVTVLLILAFLALLCTIASVAGPWRCPLWVPVFLLCLYALIQQLPIGRA